MVWTRGSRTSAAPTSPSPGRSASASGGTPASRSARTSVKAHPGACSAGFSTTALPVASAGGDHAAGDGHGEVPGGDDRDHAARAPAHRVALAGHLQQLLARLQRDRAAGVVLEEVDRLAHVRVGLGPRLRALADLQRGHLQPALAQPPRGGEEHLGPLAGRAPAPRAVARGGRPPAPRRRRPPSPRRPARRGGRAARGRTRPARRPRARPSPTHTGTRSTPRASCARSASASCARTGARRSSRTGSLANGFTTAGPRTAARRP